MLSSVLLILTMCVSGYAVVPETLSESDKTHFLSVHNRLRTSLCIPKLVWDAKLATVAEYYTSGCNRKQPSLEYGENLYYSYTKITDHEKFINKTMDEWAGVVDIAIPYGHCSIKSKTACGPATQVMWRNTKHVGCSLTHCTGPLTNFAVCIYYPRGNIEGETVH